MNTELRARSIHNYRLANQWRTRKKKSEVLQKFIIKNVRKTLSAILCRIIIHFEGKQVFSCEIDMFTWKQNL